MVVVALVGGGVVYCIGNGEWYESICFKTGMIRLTQGYGPFETHKVSETPLSHVLVKSGYRDPHQHEWVYEHGGGRAFFKRSFCGLGHANGLRPSVESEKVALTVQLLIANTDRARVDKWLSWVFDPEMSLSVHGYCFDVEEHTNRQEFINWLREREDMIAEDYTIRTNR